MHNDMEQELYPGRIDRDVWPPMASAHSSTTTDKPARILLVADISGAGPDYHVGDEAMAEVTIKRLKKIVGADNLVVACAKPEAIEATYGIKGFAYYNLRDQRRKRMWWSRPLSAIKFQLQLIYQLLRCDVVLVCGGGNLTSVWPDVLEARLHLLSWAKCLKKPFYLVSQTLGPFSDEHRRRAQDILANAEWIGVRDKSFSAGQLDLPVHFAVDDAVFLPPQHSKESKALMVELGPSMAISLRNFGSADQDRLNHLSRCMNRLALRHKLSVVFIPHHSPGGGGDTAIGKEIQERWLGAYRFRILHPIPLASELKAVTGDCKLVITMRYHQLVFALSMGVPVVGIYVNEYTQAKLNGAFEQFGLTPRTLSMEEAEDKLPDVVEELMNEAKHFQTAGEKTLQSSLKANMRSIDRLRELHCGSAD